MIRLRGFTNPSAYRGGVVAIGNFDGVHRGHQAMMAELRRRADRHQAPAVVLTFDPHPVALLRPEHTPPPLSTLERKQELLELCGIDCTIAYPTDQALLQLSPESFFQQIVVGSLGASGMVEGPNFYFGRDRAGNIDRLRELCRDSGLSLDIIPPIELGGEMISSSRVRRLIKSGEIRSAVELLGHPYQVAGIVSRGAGRGRQLGFPTANLDGVKTLLPAEGVYAGCAYRDGVRYACAIHLGPNPTFEDEARKLEAHVLSFSGDLYDSELKLEFLSEIRPVRKFESAAALRAQLQADVAQVQSLVPTLQSE